MYAMTTTPQEMMNLPLAAFKGEIEVIDSPGESFDKAIRYLSRQKIIGFDTETRPCFSPGQPQFGVSLLQLSGHSKAFLFRVNMLGMHKRLRNILSNGSIVKVGAAVHDDIRGLRRLHDFTPAGFADLQKMVNEYGIKDKSVKKMGAIILGVRISKSQQLSNWEAEKLSEPQQLYAATDAWICREMYLKLLKSEKNPLPEEILYPERFQQDK